MDHVLFLPLADSGRPELMTQADGFPLPPGVDPMGRAGYPRRPAHAPMESPMPADIAEKTREDTKNGDTKSGGIAADRLRSIVDRIERLEEERKALSSDIKDIYAEAKSAGFDVKVLRQIIRIRKQEPAEVEEQEALIDVYRRALGM
jgi:uncharacterized protein (UPF0335 family)